LSYPLSDVVQSMQNNGQRNLPFKHEGGIPSSDGDGDDDDHGEWTFTQGISSKRGRQRPRSHHPSFRLSVTDLDFYYSELAKEDEKSFRKTCDQLRRLSVHLKAEYNYAPGVLLDVTEERDPSP
jgi:hypothetical protein